MNEKVLKELVKSRKILKKKFQSVKQNDYESNNHLENTFKPLTIPLNNLIKLSHENNVRNIPEEHTFKFETSTPKKETKNELTLDANTIKKKFKSSININDYENEEESEGEDNDEYSEK